MESVTAPDDTTVVMTTDVPAPIMTTLDLPILPEHVWKNLSSGAAAEAGLDGRCRTEAMPILGGVAEHHAACFLTDESVKIEDGNHVGR